MGVDGRSDQFLRFGSFFSRQRIGIPNRSCSGVSVCGSTVVLAYFSLVFGELVPKRVAMKKPESLALGMFGNPARCLESICTVGMAFDPFD